MKSTAAEITNRQGSTSDGDAPQTGERARVGDADSLLWRIVRPVGMAALFLTLWGLAVRWSGSDLFPAPGNVARGIIELIQKGLLIKYIVASVFRVSWGFTLAVVVGVPLGLVLGVAWLVVVAAEMIAVNSGLGYLIIDARNAGKRYDLVVAGMVMIGLIGLILDLLVRQLEKFDEVRWGYVGRRK